MPPVAPRRGGGVPTQLGSFFTVQEGGMWLDTYSYLAYSAYVFRLSGSTTNLVERTGYGASPVVVLQHHIEQQK